MAKINNDINSKTDEVNKVIKQLACLKASLNEMQTKRAHEQERKIVLERLIADVQSDIMTKQAKEQQGYKALSENLDSPSDKKPLFSGMNIVNGGGNVSTHPRKVKTSKKAKKVKSSTSSKKQHSVKSFRTVSSRLHLSLELFVLLPRWRQLPWYLLSLLRRNV
jgi:hypothetical protein